MIREWEAQLESVEADLKALEDKGCDPVTDLRRSQLEENRAQLLAACINLTAEDRVYLARRAGRPGTADYIAALFQGFFECRGDRLGKEDASILGGIALYKGRPVTVIGHRKGKDLKENLKYNFGMPGPEGYRKAQRLMRQAEKFGRPVITLIDTPGAYPGLEAEERGQGEAIASALALMAGLNVPIISLVIGEGGSGGALALAVGNRVLMLEHAVYSVLSPEGFASILWKDPARAGEAAEQMKLTARDLMALGVADEIIPEPPGGAHRDPAAVFAAADHALAEHLQQVTAGGDWAARRYQKFRAMGEKETL